MSPFAALDTSPRTAFLDSFDAMNPNGTWTLFVADVSAVGVGTLESWGVTVDGSTSAGGSPPAGVPDAGGTFGLLGIACAGLIIGAKKILLRA